jgi:multiple antibiotic resistance protein
MWQERLNEFVTLLLVVNPIAVLPVFVAVVGALDLAEQRKVALYASAVSFVILVFFVYAGGFLLRSMGISLTAFQISGGLVLFTVAAAMVRGDIFTPSVGTADPFALAVYPISIPKIAGPGAMLTIVLLTDDDRFNRLEQLATIGVLLAVMAIQLAVLLLAGTISRLVGAGGVAVVTRVMGVLLAALAVNMVLTATAAWLGLPSL